MAGAVPASLTVPLKLILLLPAPRVSVVGRVPSHCPARRNDVPAPLLKSALIVGEALVKASTAVPDEGLNVTAAVDEGRVDGAGQGARRAPGCRRL